MFRISLKPGVKLMINKREYEISKISKDNRVELVDLKYNDISQYAYEELIKLLSEGHLKFELKGRNIKESKQGQLNTESDIPDISECKDIEIAKYRLEVIKPILDCKKAGQAIENRVLEINRLIDTKSEEELYIIFNCRYFRKISRATVFRWRSYYHKANGDIRSLIPSYDKSGGRGVSRLNTITMSFVNEGIEESYKASNRISINDLYDLIKYKIYEYNEFSDKKLMIPSYSTLRRYVMSIPEYELLITRYGKREADNKFKALGQGVKVNRLLERVEIDATPIDILLRMEDKTIERPKLVAAIDKYSRNIVGFSISIGSVGWQDVMQCMRHIMMDKSYIKDKYPEIENSWEAFGVPQCLVIDNGKEFKNKAMKDAALQCGFELQYCPPRTPEWKGSIERFFGVQNSGFIHNLNGTTRSNPQCLSEEENPCNRATLNFCSFVGLIHKWIIDVYSQRLHRGINATPSNMWKYGMQHHRPQWPNDINELAILLGKVAYRKIRRSGVQINNLYYNSVELNQLLHNLNTLENDKPAKIKYDPYDISYIFVLDQFKDNRWLKVPSTNLSYTSGLTEYEHQLICTYTRNQLGVLDDVALVRAKKYIYDHIFDNVEFVQKVKKKNMNSVRAIVEDYDQSSLLLPLPPKKNVFSMTNLGHEYTPKLEGNIVLIKMLEKERKENLKKINKHKEVFTNNTVVNKKDLKVSKLENKNSKNNTLDDIDLKSYKLI